MNVIKGDDTGAENIFAWRTGDGVFSSASPAEVLSVLRKKGKKAEADPDAVVFLLRNSLIPAPKSAYKSIFCLGVGDCLEFGSEGYAPDFWCDYPYYRTNSRGDSVPSTEKLLNLLAASLSRKIKAGSILMLSSGKDSAAIALAARHAGIADKITAYTYADVASGYAEEARDASAIAAKLGLRHKIIEIPSDPVRTREALTHFFQSASYPSCDPTTIPYVVGLYHEGIGDTDIIDGTRSDMFMGMFPPANYRKLYDYYKLLGGGWRRLKGMRALIPHHSKAVKFFSTWPEINFYRHGHFRAAETRRFFDHDIDTEQYWLEIFQEQRAHSFTDAYGYLNDQFFAGAGILPKIKTVAESLNSTAALPWADKDIIDYYFNLPQDHKQDIEGGVNKILLRNMLREYLDYDDAKIGKRIFYFNQAQFVLANRDFVRDEVLSCALWNGNMERELEKFIAVTERFPRAGAAIIDLFMISGWHNHCRFLKEA